MRIFETIWTGFFFLFLVVMVSCDAPGCFWERKTDNQGLTRHRAACHFYKRSSTLASQKRQDRAKNAISSNLPPDLAASALLVGGLSKLLQTSANVLISSLLENLSSPACEEPSEPEAYCTLQAPQANVHGTWVTLYPQFPRRFSRPA